MRILLACHRYPPDAVAGVERVTQMLAHRLRAGGDDVSVLTRRADGTKPLRLLSEVTADGTIVRRIVGGTADESRFLTSDERIGWLAECVFADCQPEVLHVMHLHGLTPRLAEIAHRHGLPVVLTLHDFHFACPLMHLERPSGELCDGPNGGQACATTCFSGEGEKALARWTLRATYFRRILRLFDRVISPSQYVFDYFCAFGADPARMQVVPNGTLTDDRVQRHPPTTRESKSQLNLAFLGTVVPHKGLALVLDAIAVAELGPVELLALGDTPDPAYAARLLEQASEIEGLKLRLHGRYELVDLDPLLTNADLVVVPSQVRESFSIVAREALVRGIPVLASRIGALPEVIQDGHNGWTFDHSSVGDLAALLERLWADESLRRRLSDGARSTVVTSLDEHASAVRDVYTSVLNERSWRLPSAKADAEELQALHRALSAVGFGDDLVGRTSARPNRVGFARTAEATPDGTLMSRMRRLYELEGPAAVAVKGARVVIGTDPRYGWLARSRTRNAGSNGA